MPCTAEAAATAAHCCCAGATHAPAPPAGARTGSVWARSCAPVCRATCGKQATAAAQRQQQPAAAGQSRCSNGGRECARWMHRSGWGIMWQRQQQCMGHTRASSHDRFMVFAPARGGSARPDCLRCARRERKAGYTTNLRRLRRGYGVAAATAARCRRACAATARPQFPYWGSVPLHKLPCGACCPAPRRHPPCPATAACIAKSKQGAAWQPKFPASEESTRFNPQALRQSSGTRAYLPATCTALAALWRDAAFRGLGAAHTGAVQQYIVGWRVALPCQCLPCCLAVCT